jgi:hypothetical protein
MIYQIILQFIIFVFASFVSFFLPGWLVISAFKLKSRAVNLTLSYVFGIVMWALQGYIFGYLNVRWFTYIYLSFVFLFQLFRYKHIALNMLRNISFKVISGNKITLFLISVGIIIQLVPVVGSGLNIGSGIIFFGNNAYDGLTHLGFVQSLIDHFPPVDPGAYGLALRNYHYLTDLVLAEFSRIWNIPITLLLFEFFPLLISLLTGIAAYLAVRCFGGSKTMANWMIFLLYFAGDGAYLIILLLHGIISFNTPAIDNGALQFLNMPNAMAKMIFITALIPLQFFISSNRKTWGILSVLFFAPLVGFKIYFGIFSILGFSLLILGKLIFRFIRSKEGKLLFRIIKTISNEWFNLFLLIIFAIIVLAIYLPANSGAGGLFYAPLEWPKSLLGTGSIDWRGWWLRMQVYEAHANYRNIYILDIIAIIITLISVYGTRLIGFILTGKLLNFLGWEKTLFFIPSLVIFQFLGFYTLQVTGGLNVFYFFVVSCTVLSLFGSIILWQLSQSRRIFVKMFLIIFIILTIPRATHEVVYNVGNYWTQSDSYTISNDELSAMKYIDLHTDKNAVIQSSPNNEKDHKVGYLSTFSKRLTYLSGIVFLETRNQKISDRKTSLEKLFNAQSAKEFVELAKINNIEYVYLQNTPQQNLRFAEDSLLLKTLYENRSVRIIKII